MTNEELPEIWKKAVVNVVSNTSDWTEAEVVREFARLVRNATLEEAAEKFGEMQRDEHTWITTLAASAKLYAMKEE